LIVGLKHTYMLAYNYDTLIKNSISTTAIDTRDLLSSVRGSAAVCLPSTI